MVIPRVRLAGLDASKNYRIKEVNVKINEKPCYLDGKVVSGRLLMEAASTSRWKRTMPAAYLS